MTQTWRLAAFGAVIAAVLALAIGTASARATKVIIIRDGSVEIETSNATVHPKAPDRYKHNTDIVATRIEVFQDNGSGNVCGNQIASIPFSAPNVLQVIVSPIGSNPNPDDPVSLYFNVETHREQGVGIVTSLSFGKQWRFEPLPRTGNSVPQLVDSGNNNFRNYRIREVRWYDSPDSSNFIRLGHGSTGRKWLCVRIIEEDDGEAADADVK